MNILDTVTRDENLKIAVIKDKSGCEYNFKFYPEVINKVKKGDVVVVIDKNGTTHLGTVCEIKKYANNVSGWVVGRINAKKAKQNYYKQEYMLLDIDGE